MRVAVLTGQRRLLAVALACAVATMAAAPAAAQPAPKIHPALERELAKSGVAAAWVFLADKPAGAGESPRAPDALTPRAIQRRSLRRTAPGLWDSRDLPIDASRIDDIRSRVDRVRTTSRWLNAVSVDLTPAQADALAALDFVTGLQPVRRGRVEPAATLPHVPDAGDGTRGPPPQHGEAEPQLDQINLLGLHGAGLDGTGVIIGVLDTGFVLTHEVFLPPAAPPTIIASYDFLNDDAEVGPEEGDDPSQHHHGTLILGCMASNSPGWLVGAAPGASYVLAKTEDVANEQPVEEDYYVAGLEFCEASGADVVTASLSYYDWYDESDYDGMTGVTTLAVNIATANGVFCCSAAGNRGHDDDPQTSHLGAPADAFEVITVGAARLDGSTPGFTSDGPTADGRVKPEVMARGVNTVTISATSDTDLVGASGTSLATPLAAGAVACLVQAHPDWTVDEMRTYLFTSAQDYAANGAFDPLYVRGYGVLDAGRAAMHDCDGNGIDDADDIAAGDLADCNGNGIPDTCEIAAGVAADLNGSGVPDDCAACPADWNEDGVRDTADFFEFFGAFFATPPSADFNLDGATDTADFFEFFAAFFGDC